MKVFSVIGSMIRTDMAERTRRYSFLITLGILLFLGYYFLPPADVIVSMSLKLDTYRGIYNSAWVGASIAIIASMVLSLPSFYLVKNAIARDEQSRMGQIIAATPMGRVLYTLGKALSNFVFLSIMVLVLMAAALLTQLLRSESMVIQWWDLFSPFIFSTLPVMAMVAALAVLFETIPFLRGGFGNVVYFFLFMFSVSMSSISMSKWDLTSSTMLGDFFGMAPLLSSMRIACREVFPDYTGGIILGVSDINNPLQTFVWDGVQWDWGILSMRLLWCFIALLCALLASIFFNRFDTAAETRKPSKKNDPVNTNQPAFMEQKSNVYSRDITLTPLDLSVTKVRLTALILSELKLAVKGASLGWFLVSAGIMITGLFIPLQGAKQFILSAALIWPLLRLSPMGTREKMNRTDQIVFSSPYAASYQLLAAWLSGLILPLCLCSAVLIRLMITGEFSGFYALAAGLVFITSLALSAGIWSGNGRLFEVFYMLLWYIGPVNKVPFLDYAGASSGSPSLITATMYLAAAVVLLSLAFLGRRLHLQQ